MSALDELAELSEHKRDCPCYLPVVTRDSWNCECGLDAARTELAAMRAEATARLMSKTETQAVLLGGYTFIKTEELEALRQRGEDLELMLRLAIDGRLVWPRNDPCEYGDALIYDQTGKLIVGLLCNGTGLPILTAETREALRKEAPRG